MRLVFIISIFCSFYATSLKAQPCLGEAISLLKNLDPNGYRNYRDLSDKQNWFNKYIDCSNLPVSLATAVHESTHFLDLTRESYALTDGNQISMVPGTDLFFAPKLIAQYMNQNDIYVKTYLLGNSSSKDSFLIFLDELNAYTRDTRTSVKLLPLFKKGMYVASRDALLANMNFLRIYAYEAKRSFPQTWDGLRRQEVSEIIKVLWREAESALSAACPHSQLATPNEATYLKQLYDDSIRNSALSEVLGRQILMPKACTK